MLHGCTCKLKYMYLFPLHSAPNGLEDVSKYPHLFAELIRRGYTTTDIEKISHFNILRVLYKVEQVQQTLVVLTHMEDVYMHNMLLISKCV